MKQQKKLSSLVVPLLLALATLFLGACGGDKSDSNSGQASEPQTANEPVAKMKTPVPSREIVVEANDQMKFSVTEIVVAPGETVTLTLNNVGTMPKFSMGHNLVILEMGTDMIAFAEASAMSPTTDYVSPDYKDKILAATKLLGGGEIDSIIFTAPQEAGLYQFLCTFPGHLQAGMKGFLKVQ